MEGQLPEWFQDIAVGTVMLVIGVFVGKISGAKWHTPWNGQQLHITKSTEDKWIPIQELRHYKQQGWKAHRGSLLRKLSRFEGGLLQYHVYKPRVPDPCEHIFYHGSNQKCGNCGTEFEFVYGRFGLMDNARIVCNKCRHIVKLIK